MAVEILLRRPIQGRIGCGPNKKATRLPMQATEQAVASGLAPGSAPGALALFENARRDAGSLWLLKWQLWKAGQEKFYKTSRKFKAIDRLCWWVPNTVTR